MGTNLGEILTEVGTENQPATDSPYVPDPSTWDIVGTLGEGGLGRVFRVHNVRSGVDAALKVLRPNLVRDPVARATFRTEEGILRNLCGASNIIQLHPDHNHDTAEQAIVMELAEGGSLEARPQRAMLPGDVVRIGIETLRALEAAHRKGIIHRDVKPANILLDADAHVRLTDWGIALQISGNDNEVKAGFVPCTPVYMSPEQAEERPGEPRSDVYSLGCSLYELLTGEQAFDPEHSLGCLELMLRHCRKDGPNPRRRNKRIPRGVAAVVEQSMRRKPEERFPSAKAMREALEWCQLPFTAKLGWVLNPLRWIGCSRN